MTAQREREETAQGARPTDSGHARRSTGATRLVGLIGWPVGHSLSPPMHEAAIEALGLDLRYLAFPVEPARLAQAIAGAAALGFVGLNVTAPHKQAVMALCEPDEQALRVGAVNTLLFDGSGPPRGVNTDVHGARMLLAGAGIETAGRRALVLGAGGAARGVAFALLEGGARVAVIARRPAAMSFPGLPPVEVLAWDGLAGRLRRCDLLVDATGRGLDAEATLDLAPLPAAAAVVDLVVRASTNLIEAARARGLRACSGEAMLLHQGAAAFTLWTGRPAPLAAMERALREALAQ